MVNAYWLRVDQLVVFYICKKTINISHVKLQLVCVEVEIVQVVIFAFFSQDSIIKINFCTLVAESYCY